MKKKKKKKKTIINLLSAESAQSVVKVKGQQINPQQQTLLLMFGQALFLSFLSFFLFSIFWFVSLLVLSLCF